MLLERIVLIDRSGPLAEAWTAAFSGVLEVEVVTGDYFSRDADAMVSPANSFGIMDGGLDAAIVEVIGAELQTRVRGHVMEHHHGEIPVGVADIVATGHGRWPYLIVAPTMRIPGNVANTVNAYLAFRAILLAIRQFNERGSSPIRSIVVPGLGTGIGGMPPTRCAHQMRAAFDQARRPAIEERNVVILQTHRDMLAS